MKEIKKYKMMDCHLHLGNLAYLNMPSGRDGRIIDVLKGSGIERAVFSHHGSFSTVKPDFSEVFSLLNRYEGFLFAYLVFNPNHSRLFLESIKRHISDSRILGIKIHPSWHQCYPYDKRYDDFWEYTSTNGIVVLTHSWNPNVPNKAQKYSDPHFFEKISKKYPEQKIILAHAGGRGEYFLKVLEILQRNKNFFVDFAGDTFVPNIMDKYVEKIGSDRILFGSDMPWIDVRHHISTVINSAMSEEDKKNIFYANAQKLFGLS